MSWEGSEVPVLTPVDVEHSSTFLYLPSWTDLSLVCWSGLRLGGRVTVHLCKEVYAIDSGYGGSCACFPNWGASIIWSFGFGFKNWPNATLCKNCFNIMPNGAYAPKAKKMPTLGWITYREIPSVEKRKNKPAAVVQQIFGVSPRTSLRMTEDLEPRGDRRIVEL